MHMSIYAFDSDSEHILKNSTRELNNNNSLHWKTSVDTTHQKIQKAFI